MKHVIVILVETNECKIVKGPLRFPRVVCSWLRTVVVLNRLMFYSKQRKALQRVEMLKQKINVLSFAC